MHTDPGDNTLQGGVGYYWPGVNRRGWAQLRTPEPQAPGLEG